jgi:tetratricopeptide (TPR) repeat protein
MGGIEHARARYAQGEPHARQAVMLRTRALGAGHPTVAADVAALAAIVEGRGRLAEAQRLYQRALAVFRRAFGPGSYEVGVNLAGLAGVYQARGRGAEAERLYREALAIHRRLFGDRHIEVALTLNNLAITIARHPARQTEALRVAKRALVAFRAAGGPHHPGTLLCAANVASWSP